MLYFLISIFSFVLVYSNQIEKPSSISDSNAYTDFCRFAACDDECFANFKRSSIYNVILEHVSYGLGKKYLKIISRNYPYLLQNMDQFRENDSIGNPVTFSFGKYGLFSPTTLRYVKIAGDLMSMNTGLNNARIIEIGGGYGGQCKILSQAVGFKEYIIVDLPDVLLLAKRYLDEANVKNVKFLTLNELGEVQDCDLLISNFAFSECYKEIQDTYLDKVIRHSKHGYIIHNGDDFDHSSFYHTEDLLSYLKDCRFSPNLAPETPQTAIYGINPNVLLTW